MQFIAHKRKLPLAFANPLEAAIPAKEEGGGTLLMGKYWKRKMDGILAEYKKWRIFYKDKNSSSSSKVKPALSSPQGGGSDDIDLENMIANADFFVDAIFNELETNLFNPIDDWTTMDNADFIQSGLINIKQSEEEPDQTFSSFSSYNSYEQGSPPVTDYQILESCDPLTLYQDHQASHSYQPQGKKRDRTSSQLANLLQVGQYERHPPPPPPPQTVPHISDHIENTIVKKKSVIVSLSSVTSDLMSVNTTEPSTSTLTPGAKHPPMKKIKLDKRSSSSSSRKSSEKQPVGESTNASFAKLNILVPSLADSSMKISKAAQLIKTSEHIEQLQEDNDHLSRDIEMLRSSSKTLLSDIAGFQNKLSFNSSQTPSSQQSKEKGTNLSNLFSDHIKSSTQQNWKYWIFSRLMRPLQESFDR